MISLECLLCLLFIIQQVNSEYVKCDHTTPVCECMETADKVCEFQMDIELLQTFTRYEVDQANGDSRGTAGRVWYIDDNGNYRPLGSTGPCGANVPIGNRACSDPFAVDGYTFRSFIAVNGRIPGPTLIVSQYQLVKVNVINRLASESISIHWHGMHQRNSNWMDGVAHVTQCGIPPLANFTYIFNASQYGTHWYHSHSGAQRTDGLFGALIVNERNDDNIEEVMAQVSVSRIIDLPGEHTLTLLDWQKANSIDLFTQIHSSIRYFDVEKAEDLILPGAEAPRTISSDGAEVGPVTYWSGLINGKGRHKTVPYNKSNLSIFDVSPDTVYRFRLIGAQSLFAYRFSIDRHNMTVIATDGEYIEPVDVDYIIIHSGERYDFLLRTKSVGEVSLKANFLIRAVTLEINTETRLLLETNTAEGILHYNTEQRPSPTQYASIASDIERDSERCTPDSLCNALNCPFKAFPDFYNTNCTHIHQLNLLFPLSDNVLPDAQTDDKLFFNFGFEGVRQTSAINARNLQLPPVALALASSEELEDIRTNRYCTGLDDERVCDRDNTEVSEIVSPECFCTHVVDVSSDRSVQLVISAIGPEPRDLGNFLFAHPIHLHGHYFHVVDIQFGQYGEAIQNLTAGNTDINCGGQYLCTALQWNKTKDYSTGENGKIRSRAPLKDTLLVPAGGYAVVYFRTDNPGWWFLHCHIEVHQLEGMGVIINEGDYDSKTPAPYFLQSCGDFTFTQDQYNRAITGTLNPTDPTDPPTGNAGYGTVASVFIVIATLVAMIAT